MSTASTITPMATPLIGRRTRAYFAPVNRVSGTPTLFDPAANASWSYAAPPSPWIDLGWISNLTRTAESVIAEIDAGIPPSVQMQTRQKLGATVSFEFATWCKLTMALAASSQHMNVLAAATAAGTQPTAIGSGAKAAAAVGLAATSTAAVLYAAAGAGPAFTAGSMVVVDQDYAGQTGFVGSPVSAAYVHSGAAVGNDPDYIRRVSFNVGRIVSIGSDGGMHLAAPLPGGAPASTMKLQPVIGLVDREGGSFFQEWSALFIVEGVQGDRLCFHYPRLQACASAAETITSLTTAAPVARPAKAASASSSVTTKAQVAVKSAAFLTDGLQMVQPAARFRAFAVTDGNDGEQIVCYRTYYPSPAAFI